ncbi:hypothetical protein ACFV24_01460 [Nocardia fluminea]|uniref:nSTAND1 domain-containing NTPase n=1 Tax=Nocardia fluminea TaxID=134984 RepID=UPI0036704210
MCGVEETEFRAWDDLVERLRKKRSPKPQFPELPALPPYQGLNPFDKQQADYFYGRRDLTDHLVSSVQAGLDGSGPQVLLVFGESGAGKSSLLHAGLEWQMSKAVPITPTAVPEARLEYALATLTASGENEQILIVDQFEELWTLQPSDDRNGTKRREFLSKLSEWVRQPGRVLVVGVRDDHLGKAIAHSSFRRVAEGAVQVLVAPMDREQLTDVIRQPAWQYEIPVEDALVARLLDEMKATDAESATGALPLLSHVLLQAWRQMVDRRGDQLTYRDYELTGGVQGAVEQSAEAVYTSLSTNQRLIAKRILLRSVVVTEDSEARGRVAREDLAWSDTLPSDIDFVTGSFIKERLLTASDIGIQISHEALLKAWPRLVEWIKENRVSLLRHRRFGEDTKVWDDADRTDDYLISRGRTEEYAKWAADEVALWPLSPLEQRFLDANLAYHQEQDRLEQQRLEELQRKNTQLTRVTWALGIFLLVTLLAAGAAFYSNRQTTIARNEGLSRQAALQWELLRGRDPGLAQQVALAGYGVSHTFEARSALLDSTAVLVPHRNPTVAGSISSAVSSDGTLLAVGNSDGKVRLFETGKPGHPAIATFSLPLGHLYAAAFRPNSRQLAVGGAKGAQLWDVTDTDKPRSLTDLPGSSGKVENLGWSANGDELAAAVGNAGTLRWGLSPDGVVTTASTLRSTNAAGKPFDAKAVDYSPDGNLIATAGTNATIQIWDRSDVNVEPATQIPLDPGWKVLDLDFDPSSTRLAVGTEHTEALVFDLTNRTGPLSPQRVGKFDSFVNTVAFNTDGSALAAGSSDNSVQLFDIKAGQAHASQTLPGPAIVTSVHFHSEQLITASVDGFIRTWSLPGPVTPTSGARVLTLTANAEATAVVVGARRKSGDTTPDTVQQFDITDPHHLRERGQPMRLNPPDQSSGPATVSLDGRTAAVGTKNGAVYTWDLADPQIPQMIAPPIAGVTPTSVAAIVFTPDNRYLLAASNDDSSRITIVDRTVPTQPKIADHAIDAGNRVQLLSVSTNGKYLAASTASSVRLWDISDGPQNARLIDEDTSFGTNVSAVRFATEDVLAAGSADTTVRLYRATDTELTELAHLEGPTGQIQSLSFDPRGTQMAAGTGDDQIWVWGVTDPAHPTRIAALSAYDGRVNDVVFGPNGHSFTAAGDDSSLRTWLADPDAVAAALCAQPAALLTEDEWNRYLPDTKYNPPCD